MSARHQMDYLSLQGFTFSDPAIGGTVNRTIHLAVGTGEMNLKTPTLNETLSLAA